MAFSTAASVARTPRPVVQQCRAPVRSHLASSSRLSVRASAVEAPTSSADVKQPIHPYKPSASYGKTGTTHYAIIEVGGNQQFVQEGKWYTCNRLKAAPGDVVSFGRVLAVKDGNDMWVGQPYLGDATVEAEIIQDFKGPKVLVYKMHRKKHYRKMQGHRQSLTKCAPISSPSPLSDLTQVPTLCIRSLHIVDPEC